MRTETAPAQTAGPSWAGRAATLPVYAVAASTLLLIWFSGLVEVSYENRMMVLLLNMVPVTAVSAAGAWLAMRGYLASGLSVLLYVGCGLVAMGAGFVISSLIIGGSEGPNDAVTVHNLSVLLASLMHLAAAVSAGQPRSSWMEPGARKVAVALVGVLALTGLIWTAARYDWVPPFYITGEGTTPVRQLVLTLSIAVLSVAAALLLREAMRRGSMALRVYGLGLSLITLGLVDVSIAAPGSVLSWTGRLSQSLGHVYLLAACVVAIRATLQKGFDIKAAVADYYLESESNYRTLVDALRAAVISLDSRGRVVLWNPQAEAIFGYGYAEAAGRLLMDLIAPAGEVRRAFQDLLERPPGHYLSVTLRRKSGDEFPVEALVFEGGAAGTKWTNLIIRDISEYRQIEEELRKRELRIRQALQVSRSFAFEWNPATDEVTRSEECGRLLGLSGQEALRDSGENFFRRIHPEDRGRFVALLETLTRDRPSYTTKYRLVRPDGSLVILEETGIGFFDAEQRLSLLSGISTDVTERETSRERIIHLASFPRLNPNPITEVDLDGQVRFCNPQAERLLPDLKQRGREHPWLSDWEAVKLSVAQRGTGSFHREVAVGDRWYHQTLHFMTESRSFRIYGLDISGLKATEQQLQDSHNRLAAILESISDGFFSLDRQFRVTFINERGAKAIGQARETMLGRILWDVFPEAVGSDFEGAYQKAMTERVTKTVEAFYPPLNAWFEARAYPSDEGISVFFKNVTDRRRVEQALRENQADLNWAQSVGRIGSWRLNIQRNELLWSDENHRIFGLPKGTPMSYETFLGIVHPEDRDYVDRKWTAALRGEPYDIEHRLIVGNSVKWVRERAELEFDADGKLLGGFGITQDITEHKLADEALSKSEARFRLLAETAAGLLAASDPQRHVNDLAGRIMNHLDCHCFFNFLVAEEQPGRLRLNAWAGIPEEEAHRIEWLDYGVAVCGCVARDGVRIVAEHIPTTPDVRTELVKSYGIKAYACHPLVGVNGRLLGTLSFGTRSRETFSAEDLDLMKAVTDQVAVAMVRMQNERDLRNSSEALRQANEKLEEKVRIRTQELEDTVAALRNEILVRKKIQAELHHLSRKSLEALEADRRTVARELHDSIGGSLAAIKLGLEEAADQALREPVEGAASLETLASHLADTIKETKRIAANLRPLAIDDLGLLATIDWYTRQFCQRYENIRVVRQIEVEEQDIPEEFKIVFYRVMQEAMTNAAKHSRADTVYIRLKKLASHFEFEVEDNGCGFNPDEVFARQDQLSGFGLKSMQERSEICGGVLNLHTQPDAGTSVRVALPIGTAASGF